MLYPIMELMPVAVLQKRMTQASRKGRTYLRRSKESLTDPLGEARESAPSPPVQPGLLTGSRSLQCVQGLFLASTPEEPARGLGDEQATHQEQEYPGASTSRRCGARPGP